jgi:hypothetical protein
VSWLEGTVSDTSNFAFTIARPTVRVAAPASTVAWSIGSLRTIAWAHNLPAGALVNLDVSRNNGGSWTRIASDVASATATIGTYNWIVTGPATAAGRIRVSWADDPLANGISPTVSIVPAAITVTDPNAAVTAYVGTTRPISFSHNLGAGQPVEIALTRDGGSTWIPIATVITDAATSFSYSWQVTGPSTVRARVRARWMNDVSVSDISNTDFRIVSTVLITSPAAPVVWGAGTMRRLTWQHNPSWREPVDVDFSADGGTVWTRIATAVTGTPATPNSSTAAIRVPEAVTSRGVIRIGLTNDPAVSDRTDEPIVVMAPGVLVTNPNTATVLPIGSRQTVTWVHNLGRDETVLIELSRDNGNTWSPLAADVVNRNDNDSLFYWTVQGPATATARLRVSWSGRPAVQDISNAAFKIQ